MISNKDVLKRFDLPIRHYIDCLISHQNDKIHMTDQSLKITDCCSGCLSLKAQDAQRCDRFTLKIPYAQDILTWQVIFDSCNLKEPPDFIFDAEDGDFLPPLEDINSLVCWDWKNQESLAAVISELLEHYAIYQLERASESSILERHMQSLSAQKPNKMQVRVNRAPRGGLGALNCLVSIDVDFSRLPPYMMEQDDLHKACSVLHVCIPHPESSSIQTHLYLSPTVEFALGGSSSLRIPTYQSGLMVGEYVANVKTLLENQVQLISESYDKRKDYLAAFVSHFGKSVLEYDIHTFQKLTLLWEWNDFFFTFTIELPLLFPTVQPTFILQSIYHSQNKRPYTEKFTDFPYSPRWSGNEMVKRASSFILDVIRDFQKASVNHSDR